MNILLLGSRVTGGLANSLEYALRDRGHDMVVIEWPPRLRRVSLALGHRRPIVTLPWRRRLLMQVRQLSRRFDCVLIVKGPFITPSDIEQIRTELRAPVICWNPDSPFDEAISNRGAGIRQAVGEYDLYVTWDKSLGRLISERGQPVVVIPFGWDTRATPASAYSTARAKNLGVFARPIFVGTWTEQRQHLLTSIRHLRPVVYGNGWPIDIDIEVRRPVYGAEYAVLLQHAGCSVNILRPQNRLSHNMRTFEVPAAGGFQVAPSTPDHRQWLLTSAVLYESPDDLPLVVEEALRSRTSREPPEWLTDHTYQRRVDSLVSHL